MFAVYSSCFIFHCLLRDYGFWICFIIADVKAFEDSSGADSEAIKGMLSDVSSQLAKEEEGYLAEKKIQEQVKWKYRSQFVNFAASNTFC